MVATAIGAISRVRVGPVVVGLFFGVRILAGDVVGTLWAWAAVVGAVGLADAGGA